MAGLRAAESREFSGGCMALVVSRALVVALGPWAVPVFACAPSPGFHTPTPRAILLDMHMALDPPSIGRCTVWVRQAGGWFRALVLAGNPRLVPSASARRQPEAGVER
eukprot:366466-Chlamydomonas_euryale.AAC.2